MASLATSPATVRLTRKEARIARAFSRYEKLKERAEALYARADRLGLNLARAVLKIGKPVRISPEGKHLVVINQFSEALDDVARGGDGKVWAHAAARPFKLSTKNLD